MNAKEFIPKHENGKYSRNDVEKYAEQYADHKTKELQKEVECLYENERNLIDLTKQLKQENEELIEQMEYALNIEDELHETFVKINALLTKTNKDER